MRVQGDFILSDVFRERLPAAIAFSGQTQRPTIREMGVEYAN
jgi:hypothetical protein